MNKLLKNITLPITGLTLGLASLGNLLNFYLPQFRPFLGTLSFCLFTLYLLKMFLYKEAFIKDIKDVDKAVSLPTASMTIMVLSTYMRAWPLTAKLIFVLGIILHCLIILFYSKIFIQNYDIHHVLPGIFVVYVGFTVASVTCVTHGMDQLGQHVFRFSFIAYCFLLPLVLYRLIFIGQVNRHAYPTYTILLAPPSLLLVGYLNTFSVQNKNIVTMLLITSVIMLLIVLYKLPIILRQPFSNGDGALTFPFVIHATAFTILSNNYKTMYDKTFISSTIEFYSYALSFFACGITLYVTIRFMISIVKVK